MTSKPDGDAQYLERVRAELGDYDGLVAEAREALEAEQGMTLKQGLRRYPKAIGWSVLLSAAIIMEGFDLVLMASFYALPQFQRFYGEQLPDGQWTIPAQWQMALQNGVQVGSIIGLTLNGIASDRYGYRKTMIFALILMIAVIFIPFFAPNIQVLLAGQIIAGIPWGIFQSLTTAYASEVVPACLRQYLTAYVNLCWVIGQLIASSALRGVLDWDSQWSFRLPFALQWIWPVPILIGCFFAPESPWWLVRKGLLPEARHSLRRLNTNITDQQISANLALMVHTNQMEKDIASGTSYLDLFRGVDLRRTEVAAGAWFVQNACGSAFMGFSTYFLERAGLNVSYAFTMSIGQYALGAVGTVASWALMTYFGRRTLYLFGLSVQTVLLTVIGGLGFISRGNMGASWAIGAMLLIFTAVYDATVGPVCYVIVAETSSTRLRAKTVVIARIVYNCVGIVNNIIMPYFLNAGQLDWGGKTGLFWAGLGCLCLIWTYFRLPEMAGRTYGELDVLFEERVPARKFKATQVDQFASHEGAAVALGDVAINEKARVEAREAAAGEPEGTVIGEEDKQWMEERRNVV